MYKNRLIFLSLIISLSIAGFFAFASKNSDDDKFISYEVDLKTQNVRLYWKDDKNQIFGSLGNLKTWLGNRKQKLVFATNAGMFNTNHTAVGLFVQNQVTNVPLDTASGNGNFYLKPNGVFYITTGNKGVICKTEDFNSDEKIEYATQSGPMLIINGQIHPRFMHGSKNINIRNGVGILDDGNIIFVMSKKEINFYDFANYFKIMGCNNALYLDGFVSRTYLPEKEWMQTDGDFGVIVGVTLRAK
ncbi:phosphodiester glycosidase family protein [Hymenobacter caeli]|uniref:Uncharacterized protein YigE (DUF2233 family) n=1 Tax=Hymenobacter caeli TaxID=2735894 RepID=A0ABX2FLP9_9BACT|nr:phosphodiester glycosidase family protein [Hymenobacter caeli]NRT17511.1 uncharacterized protein YigE (DUF2233 family) [Hymenobacter caeli]